MHRAARARDPRVVQRRCGRGTSAQWLRALSRARPRHGSRPRFLCLHFGYRPVGSAQLCGAQDGSPSEASFGSRLRLPWSGLPRWISGCTPALPRRCEGGCGRMRSRLTAAVAPERGRVLEGLGGIDLMVARAAALLACGVQATLDLMARSTLTLAQGQPAAQAASEALLAGLAGPREAFRRAADRMDCDSRGKARCPDWRALFAAGGPMAANFSAAPLLALYNARRDGGAHGPYPNPGPPSPTLAPKPNPDSLAPALPPKPQP